MSLTKIKTEGVTDDAITSGKIPANAVGSSEIAADAVTEAKIANDAVRMEHILGGAVTDSELASNAVSSAKIATGAVIAGKIAADAVTGATLANPLSIADDRKISFGTGTDNDLEIFHESTSNTNHIIAADGDIHLRADNFQLISDDSNGRAIYLNNSGGHLELGFDGNHDAQFAGTGVTFLTNVDANAGLDVTGNITGTTTISDSKGNVRSIPSNAQGGAYVAVAADAGKAIYISTGGVTLNDSVFSAGDAVTIINNSGSDQTITQGSGVTMYNTADAATGNRTLAGRGMATVWFAAANTAYISGAGLS